MKQTNDLLAQSPPSLSNRIRKENKTLLINKFDSIVTPQLICSIKLSKCSINSSLNAVEFNDKLISANLMRSEGLDEICDNVLIF